MTNRIMTCLAAFAVAFFLSASGALAQIGVAQNSEKTTAEAADQLLKNAPGGEVDLSKNGIDNSEGVMPNVEAKTIVGEPVALVDYPATGMRLLNCSGGSVKVRTFNSNDTALLIAYEEKSIGNGDYRTLGCATRACKISVAGGKVKPALVGLHAIMGGGSIKEVTAKAFTNGCGAVK